MNPDAFLLLHDGIRLRVGPAGLVLGRASTSDVLLDDLRASRHHALIRWGPDGLVLHSLGRHPSQINGAPVASQAALRDGDRVELPGLSLVVEAPTGGAAQPRWVIEAPGGRLIGLTQPRTRFGGPADRSLVDVILPGLRGAGCIFHLVEDALLAELPRGGAIDQDELDPGALEAVLPGQVVRVGVPLTVRGDVPAGATAGAPRNAATAARFEFRPVGGELELDLEGRTIQVGLSEMRARLVATLLAPPSPYRPGDHLPDAVVLGRVWPSDANKGRVELNVLVHRVRQELLKVGLDPGVVLSRPRSGGSIAFRLAEGAEVSVR